MAEDVDLVRLEVLKAYWKKHPPLQMMVAAYLGIGQKDETPKAPDGQQDFSALLSLGAPIEGPFVP